MNKKLNSLLSLLCVLIMFMGLALPSFAAMDTGRDCTLTMEYRDKESTAPIVGAEFELYLMAKPGGSGYELTGSFRNMPVDLSDIESLDMADTAKTVEALASLYGIEATREGKTNAEGELSIGGLEAGLYLLRGHSHSQDGLIYTCSPVLVFLPYYDETDNEWVYDVEISAKSESKPQNDGEKIELHVLKVWKDDGLNRPKEIKVHLLRNGESVDTVILSARNNWSHTWKELEKDSAWMVAEDVPEGYTVNISREGKTFVITNTKPGEPPPPPPPPPELPQTGQLWWPIPLMLVLGIALYLGGYLRSRGGRDEG